MITMKMGYEGGGEKREGEGGEEMAQKCMYI
jgi:hypothetical protein